MPRVRPPIEWPQGQVRRLRHVSSVLQDNPWRDPHERELCVYLPPGYEDGGAPFAALWDLAAFTNAGPGHLNWRNHGENLAQRLDRLIHEGGLPPVVVVMPDAYTSLGGNQYVDSPAVGRYETHVIEELVPFVSEQFNVVDGAAGRGVFGKSSGGYGALVHAMRHPDTWGAAAVHAGDCGFDRVFLPEFGTAAQVLAEYGGDPLALVEAFWRKRQPGGREFTALMIVAMAASYDPDPDHPEHIRLPFDVHTCALDDERWAAWLRHDPLTMIDDHADALRGLRCLHIDVGHRDQYNIQFGTRQLSAELEKRDIRHHFEEFDGTHSHIDWRLDISLPRMAGALEGRQ
ncbi:hypothetical protein F3N42_07735 [Marinihelvus fidelis]|uniref:Enterochelin esterase n=1 Tax=Marinihelvus fidelis TaxID=2613842 RepID=A0A5N0TAQ6_9GAMM|nr:alpha/beta hydrolase-fold protein [Marinihelvus fidelis]KAA9132052.1 hypothetical protein F3N42_07735 [Marinihelvus fidelis]